MPRLAIIGSCITRDVWPDGADLLFISKTSVASLTTPPLPLPESLALDGLCPWEAAMIRADFDKSHLKRLRDFAPTDVIFDFAGERFPVMGGGEAKATLTAEFIRARGRSIGGLIDRFSEGGLGLFRQGLQALRSEIADARIFLHETNVATAFIEGVRREYDPLQELWAGGPLVDLRRENARFEWMHWHFRQVFPAAKRVRCDEHRVGWAGHRWGLSPYHYVPAYYDAIRDQIGELSIETRLMKSSRGCVPAPRRAARA